MPNSPGTTISCTPCTTRRWCLNDGLLVVVLAIADEFRAPACCRRSPIRLRRVGSTFTHRISQAALEQWAAKSMHEDPYVSSAMERGLLVEGVAVNGDDLV